MRTRQAGVFRNLLISLLTIIFLLSGLSAPQGIVSSQGDVPGNDSAGPIPPIDFPPPDSEPVVVSVEVVNPYFTVETLAFPDGQVLTRDIISGPPSPPAGYTAHQETIDDTIRAGAVILTEVPTFRWVFGCSAVSGSMVAGYYDRSGYSDIYTGPTNGGVYPLVEYPTWGSWTDNTPDGTYPNNPLIASHLGLDERTTKGSIDDYWVSYGSSAKDPYITGSWAQHAWGSAIGDYMKTSQSAYGNTDGATSFYGYTSISTKLTCSAMESFGISDEDGTYGRKLFYEARGYSVTDCYAQATNNIASGGFSLANFRAEIDAGRPVFINLAGHSIVGVGYDPSSSTIYIHDTWYNSANTMTWGGSYSGMEMQSVSIVNLVPITTGVPAAFSKSSPTNGATGQAISLALSWTPTTPVTEYQYCISTAQGCDSWTSVGNTTSVTASGLSYATTYYWQVRAWNSSEGPTLANGETDWSFTTREQPQPPSVPGGVSASDGTFTDKVRVSWSAVTDTTYYQVFRSAANSSDNAVLLSSPTSSPFDDTSAVAGTTYWYFVKACNVSGCSAFSSGDAGYRAELPVPGAFYKTSPISGTSGLSTRVTISWGTSSGATAYYYCYDTTNDGACAKWISNRTSTSKTLNLKRNTTYYWQIRAVNSVGTTYANNSAIDFWSFKTK